MIPKVIHYCWFGGNPIPEEMQKCIDSWKRIMPDYEIKRWDESNYDVNKCIYASEAYKAKKWAFVSDYARLDICYTYGGIYLDVDVEVLKPFDDLLLFEGFCGLEMSTGKGFTKKINVGLGLGLGLGLGQEMGRIMRDDYNTISFVNPDGSLNLTSCPIIQTRLLKKYGLKPINEIQKIKGLIVFPTEYFAPLNNITGKLNITDNTYSIHHYAGSWSNDIRKDLVANNHRLYLKVKSMAIARVLSVIITYKKYYRSRFFIEIIKKFLG